MGVCKYYDKELDCCKKLSDWSDPMPILQPCVKGPCEHYAIADNEIIEALNRCQDAIIIRYCPHNCKTVDIHIREITAVLNRQNAETIVNDFKTALLKKIFPYNAVDKKQYSINAYAVEKAIAEVAAEMTEEIYNDDRRINQKT